MGRSKRGGRPKGSTYALTMMYARLYHYQKQFDLTSWNAWQKLTESKHFPSLVKHYYKRHKDSEFRINRMLGDKTIRDRFYSHNIKRRGKDLLINDLFTHHTEYTRRKKRK